MSDTLTLVLTHYWFDEIESGRKTVEYRKPNDRWMRLIYHKRKELKRVVFLRGYTKTRIECNINLIDVGDCPIAGWDGWFIRIHFTPEKP